MVQALRGEARLERVQTERSPHRLQRQRLTEDGKGGASFAESVIASDHHQRSALDDVAFQVPLILRDGQAGLRIAKVLEDDHIEGIEPLVEEFFVRKWD